MRSRYRTQWTHESRKEHHARCDSPTSLLVRAAIPAMNAFPRQRFWTAILRRRGRRDVQCDPHLVDGAVSPSFLDRIGRRWQKMPVAVFCPYRGIGRSISHRAPQSSCPGSRAPRQDHDTREAHRRQSHRRSHRDQRINAARSRYRFAHPMDPRSRSRKEHHAGRESRRRVPRLHCS